MPFFFEKLRISSLHTAGRSTGSFAASAVPFSPSRWATARAIASTGNPWPGGTRTMSSASTYGTERSSVSAMIGTPARSAARSASLSGGPTQMRTRSALDAPSTTADGSPPGTQLACEQRHELARAGDRQRPLVARAAPDLPEDRERRERLLRLHARLRATRRM